MSTVNFTAGNLNTVLLTIVLGVLSWVGLTTQQTSIAIAVITEKNANHARELIELRARVAAVEIEFAKLRRLP